VAAGASVAPPTAGGPSAAGGAASSAVAVRPPAGAPSGGGELSGKVVRRDNGGIVSGAIVVAVGPSGPLTATTDSQGNWRFAGLQAGSYTVVANVPNFVSQQVQTDIADGRPVGGVVIGVDPRTG